MRVQSLVATNRAPMKFMAPSVVAATVSVNDIRIFSYTLIMV